MSSIMKILRRIGGAKVTPTSGDEGQVAVWKAGKATTDAVSLFFHDGNQWVELLDTGGKTIKQPMTVGETAPATPAAGDFWFKASTKELSAWDGAQWSHVAYTNVANTFTKNQTIDVSDATKPAFSVKQKGTPATPLTAFEVTAKTGIALRAASDSGTAANDVGALVILEPSATAAARKVTLSLDPNGGDGKGGDYMYLAAAGDGVNEIMSPKGNLLLSVQNKKGALKVEPSGTVLIDGNRLMVGAPSGGISNNNGTSIVGAGPADCKITINHSSSSGNTNHYIEFGWGGNLIGRIEQSSTSSVGYLTSSDYRLKDNVKPLDDASTRIMRLKPCRFNFKSEPDKRIDGFLAHEVADIVPEAVSGAKDAVNEDGSVAPQGLEASKLVPLLTAALQDALRRIEKLEARA